MAGDRRVPEPISSPKPRRKSPRQRKIETSQAFKAGTTECPGIIKIRSGRQKTKPAERLRQQARRPSVADGAKDWKCSSIGGSAVRMVALLNAPWKQVLASKPLPLLYYDNV